MRIIKPLILSLLSVCIAGAAFSQSLCKGSLGDPVVNITFGNGDNPGAPLSTVVAGASTTLQYVSVTGNPAQPTPLDGQYTITNNVPFNGAWFSGAADHTTGNGNGYMAFYNSSENPGEFYSQTISNLCGATTYEFAAWIANALNPAMIVGVYPDISFLIEQTDGTILASYDTGPVTQNNAFTWVQYGFFFTTPANTGTVVLKMINNSPGGTANVGNDLAIDDITFRPCGPASTASFDGNVLTDTKNVCEGQTLSLYGSLSSGYTTPGYLWQVSNDDGNTWTDLPNSNGLQIQVTPPVTGLTQHYRYRLLAGEGGNINSLYCRVASNAVTLTSFAPPIVLLTPDTSICPDSTVQLQASGGVTYAWSPSQYLNDPGISNPIANPPAAIIYSVIVTDNNHCVNTGSMTVSIRPRPLFQAPADQIICKDSAVLLSSENDRDYLYTWSPGASLSDSTSPSPLATPLSTTLYKVRIADNVCPGYDSSFLVNVTVRPLPEVVAEKSNDLDCALPVAQLSATGALSYTWMPAAGVSDPAIANPLTHIDSTTTFVVRGKGFNGCYAFDTLTVKVSASGKNLFVVPNAFTPNGDGHNDCFGLGRWGDVTLEEFAVYNRLGQRVFTTRNPSECWDGAYKGLPQPAGGYAYVIRARSFCGEITRTGMVMLIR